MRLEVRHLEVLIAVEECSSISGAARLLGVDQPHVTRQLGRIERVIESPVFVRTTRGVTPTATGVRVLALARRALATIDELAGPQEAGPYGPRGDFLRVLYHGLPAASVLADLGDRYPNLHVSFDSTAPHDACERLRGGAADVFLAVWLPHVAWPETGTLAAVEILADPTYVYVATDHRLASEPELNLVDLADEDWIVGVDADSSTMVREECRLVGGFEPLLTHRAGDEPTVSELLARGQGVVLGSSVAARRPGVVGRPYRGSSAARWMQVYLPGRIDRDLAATIAGVLRARHAAWTETLRPS